jgi:hypothetical protein
VLCCVLVGHGLLAILLQRLILCLALALTLREARLVTIAFACARAW